MQQNQIWRNKNIFSAIAAAGVLSLAASPAWTDQHKMGSSDKKAQTKQQAVATNAMITASALQGSTVVDSQGREVGSISNLFVDPKSGRIMRADIEFSGELFGAGKEYSVAWNELDVTRKDDNLVVKLDQSIVERVQQALGSDKQQRAGDQRAQTSRQTQQPREKSDTIFGSNTQTGKDRQAISATQLNSDQIRKIQQNLNKQGFHAGEVDGKWSSQTQTAIKNFQQSKGIEATGQLNSQTLNELGLDADEFRKSAQPASESGSKGKSSTPNR